MNRLRVTYPLHYAMVINMEKILKKKLKGGKFSNVPVTRSNTMRSIKGKGNKTTEAKFRMGLVRAGINGWQMHNKKIIGKPDFYFPSLKLAVFIDGCFWHGCPQCGHIPRTNREYWQTKIQRNKSRDLSVTRRLKYRGYKVLRFWEHSLKIGTNKCVMKLRTILT